MNKRKAAVPWIKISVADRERLAEGRHVILVAGCGFVGRTVARLLRDAGEEVVGLTRHQESADALAQELNLPILACDISCELSLDEIPTKYNPDVIISCASSGRGGSEVYKQVYLKGSINLIRQFPNARVLFVSSTSVYAQNDGDWVDETALTEPTSVTSKILLESENVVRQAGGIIARVSGIYGPGRSILLSRFLAGEAVLEDGGKRYINQVHRDDAASALLFLAQSILWTSGEVYNVTDSSPLTQLECYQWLSARFAAPMPPDGNINLQRKRGVTNKKVSNAKLSNLGWKPDYPSFKEGVESLI